MIEFTKALKVKLGFSIEIKTSGCASSPSRKTKTEVSPKAEVSTVLSAFLNTYRGKKEETEENERAAEEEAIGDSFSPDEWSASGALLPKSEDNLVRPG